MPSNPAAPIVEIEGLTKTFTSKAWTRRYALDAVSLQIARGEFTVVVGPSGCGKTTLLRCVAGLEQAEAGLIRLAGRTAYSPSEKISLAPEARQLSMVFQSYALWPHKTLADNVAYPLECRGTSRTEARAAAARILETLGLGDRIAAYPAQLSGGQQQRVALARAMVAGSELVLFDEPLSNLDAQVREQIRAELGGLQRRHGFAALYVTHDQTEAMSLADNLVVMRDGRIEQMGPPQDVYMRPRTRYVASFLGRANVVEGLAADVRGGNGRLDSALGLLAGGLAESNLLTAGDRAVGLIRPEHVEIVTSARAPVGILSAEVVSSRFLGGVTESELRIGDQMILVRQPNGAPLAPGSTVAVRLPPERLTIVPDDPTNGAPQS